MHSLSELLKLHRDLDVVFTRHQHALLHFKFDEAAQLLRDYRDRLERHMAFEEGTLLPLYTERVSIEKGGEAKLFLDEHEKMKNFVQLFITATDQLKSDTSPEDALLTLLDREFFYLKLCSHHDTREARFLYAGLDAVTSDAERTDLVNASHV